MGRHLASDDGVGRPNLVSRNGTSDALTPIPSGIHYTAIPDTTEDTDELEQMQIDNFITILGEIALSVARRKERLETRTETPC